MRRRIQATMSRLLVAAAIVGGTVGLTPGDALAQQGKSKQKEVRRDPPTPKKADKSPFIFSILGVVICAGAALTTLIPSKRGHQD